MLRHHLRRSKRGPYVIREETPDVGDGRNIFAELSWAALFELNGIETIIEGDPDLITRLHVGPSVSFSFEVKRVHSPAKIETRINEGADQIAAAVRGEIDTAGMAVDAGAVVLVLDKLLPGHEDLLKGGSEREVKDVLGRVIDSFRGDCGELLDAGRGREHVLGVVLWWRPLGLTERLGGSGNVWTECNQARFVPYREKDTHDWRFMFMDALWRKAKFPGHPHDPK